ncbi:MAG: (d)CMP kinase [Synergistaceae bacterium]|jgi:cytidylate kinase|nr:(d)CMP kinase [Synergistaceae bacterium]
MTHSGRPPVIVLDGPAGAGKSSVAREIAKRLGLPFLDTGAIYRAITLIMMRSGVPPVDSPELRRELKEFRVFFSGASVCVKGEDVTDAIRTPEIDANVSPYSAIPAVRDSLLGIQREQRGNGLVAEGRDMGTVVFPDADLKIFLTASPETRARRRYDERISRGGNADYDEILRQVNMRDEIDSTRETAPLKPAGDALLMDTTVMSFEDVVSGVMKLAGNL